MDSKGKYEVKSRIDLSITSGLFWGAAALLLALLLLRLEDSRAVAAFAIGQVRVCSSESTTLMNLPIEVYAVTGQMTHELNWIASSQSYSVPIGGSDIPAARLRLFMKDTAFNQV